MSRFFTAFANNRILANMCFLLLILSGCAGLTQLVREVMPTIPENEITIRIDYPGADPEEVEEGVSIKIEEALEGVEGVKKIITRSLEGQGSALVIAKQGHSLSEVRDRVQTEINAVSTFPAGAERPLIQCEVIQDPVLTLYLAGSTTEHRMKVWAEILKADLLSLPQVSRVRLNRYAGG